tara:strand:- start:202 stop:687 length:486 start_codon:yes stop_codon:yes gene_type:complete
MKRSMAPGVEETLAPFLTNDVAWKISQMICKENFDAFKLELIDAVYKFTIRKCDYYYHDNSAISYTEYSVEPSDKYWQWINYREVCFPNELGCNCCPSSYPSVICKKKWCENQECICNDDDMRDDDYDCDCDCPYRRQQQTIQNKRDKDQPDYEYFQNQLV